MQQTLMVLRNWQNSVRPPAWQSIWMKANGIQWAVWLALVLVGFVFIEGRATSTASRQLGNEATQLITNSLPVESQSRAIQLLLIKAYNYRPEQIIPFYPAWYRFAVVVGFFYCVALSFSPNVAIAIGRGERKVQAWRLYSKFILVTTPTFVTSTFLWPKIENLLKSMF